MSDHKWLAGERWMMQSIIAEMWDDLTAEARELWVESAEKWNEEALLVAEILQEVHDV